MSLLPADALRERGIQVTAQRLAVLRAVSACPHVTADRVIDVVKAEIGTISRQSVYDALGLLVAEELIRRIQPSGSPARFEDRVGDNHHHLICRSCGRVVDVDHTAAESADQMVMVVADPVFEASRRAGGLNATDEAAGDQHAERVVHRLERDRADLGPDGLGDPIGRDVWLSRHRPEDSQSLGRDLNATLPQQVSRVDRHGSRVDQILDSIQTLGT